MRARRVFTLARRVMRQVLRDRRTMGLLFLGPMLVLTLGAVLLRADPAAVPLGVVDEDLGVAAPGLGQINLGDRLQAELEGDDAGFAVTGLSVAEVDERLRDGTVQGVLVLPADFTAHFLVQRQAVLDLRLEGSNPSRSMIITGRVTQAAMRAVAGLVGMGLGGQSAPASGETELPVRVQATYLYGGEQFDTMDYFAPAYIALLATFFVFLLACVAFLRERSQGTMERLMATPTGGLEIVLGYMLGLGLFALLQVSVILFFTVWALKIHYAGSLALLLLIIALMALVGVSLGILASAFARNEFQVLQFIPLLILPQVLLAGTIWPVSDMPAYLRPLAYAMPLTYGNRALGDVMLKGWGLAQIWPNLATLLGFAVVLVAASALMMRREVA